MDSYMYKYKYNDQFWVGAPKFYEALVVSRVDFESFPK